MKLEECLPALRKGKKIYQKSRLQDDCFLKAKFDSNGCIIDVYGSYYMTVFDIISEDWEIDGIQNKNEQENL